MIEALLEAARDHLIDALKSSRDYVGIRPDGKPPATMGEWYVSIDETGITSGSRHSLREDYRLSIWVTLRAGLYPGDRLEETYLAQSKRLTGLERSVIKYLHANHDLRTAADQVLSDTDLLGSGGFQLPLYFMARSRTQKRADWILGENPENASPCMVRELTFAGGDRLQDLSNFT